MPYTERKRKSKTYIFEHLKNAHKQGKTKRVKKIKLK